MKTFNKVLYNLRIILFIVSLVCIFLTMKNYIKIGLWGYIFFLIEFIYICTILFTILSKKKIYLKDLSFNIMHLGTYLYQIIISFRMYDFKVSSLVNESFVFYKNNFIILSVLLITLIFYTIIMNNDLIKKGSSI